MARRTLKTQTNFASGELSPSVAGRSDLERYQNGVKQALNWLPVVQGGIRRFPGTTEISNIYLASGGPTRLVSFEFAVDQWFLLVFTPLALTIYKDDEWLQSLTTPWGSDVLWEVDYAQALDTAIFVHQSSAPRRLCRLPGDSFALENLSDPAVPSGIYLENIPLQDNVLRWTPSGTRFVGDKVLPTALASKGYWYACTVAGLGAATEPTWPTTVGNTVADGAATWRCEGLTSDVQAWNDTDGWPRSVTFHENRLVFGGCGRYPNQLWLSKSGEYFNFDLGTGLADDAISVELLSDELEIIQWLASMRSSLVVGTAGSEWATIQSGFLTPELANFKRQSAIGSARVSPVSIDGALLHVPRNRNQLRELVYTDLEQSYETRSLSLLAPQATAGIRQLAVKAAVSYDAANLVFCVNADGSVGVLSSLRDQEILSWSRRTFVGGVDSVAAVGETIYFAVRSTNPDDTIRRLVKWDDAVSVDQARTVTSVTPLTHWTGFGALVGAEVQVLVDGSVHPPVTVAGDGSIDTEWEGYTLTAGLALPTPTLETLPPVFQGVAGSLALQKRRIVRTLLQLDGVRALTVNGAVLEFREAAHDVNAPVPPFSGVREVRQLGWSRDPTVVITAPDPYPATLLSLVSEVAY